MDVADIKKATVSSTSKGFAMERRSFLQWLGSAACSTAFLGITGCRGKQYAHVLKEDDKNMVGSHKAGSEVYEQQVSDAVAKLLGRECSAIQQVSHEGLGVRKKKICFVGVENSSSEDLGDFKQHLFELIDQKISESDMFEQISERVVSVGLHSAHLRPDDLFIPSNRRTFQQVMERENQPFDYLLFAKLTSGTTNSNGDYQRDYLLTLEMINISTDESHKVSAKVRKGYHKSMLNRFKHYGD